MVVGGIQNLKFGKAGIKVNWHFHWGVGRKGFVSDASCHDTSSFYFSDVDRDLNVFCISYRQFFYRSLSGLSALSPQPNLEGQVITICLGPTRSTWMQNPYLHNKVTSLDVGRGLVTNIFGSWCCKSMDLTWNTIKPEQ